MPRPRKQRSIQAPTEARYYKPQGIPMRDLKSVTLAADGLEALRLADAEGLEHVAAAEMMGVSRPTFSRLLAEARTTVATVLVNGWALDIAGHEVTETDVMETPAKSGRGCGMGLGRGCEAAGGTGQMRRRRGHRNKWLDAEPQDMSISEKQKDVSTMSAETNAALYAVTAKGSDLEAEVDPRFGRAAGFVLVDADGNLAGYVSNAESDNLAHGAGLAAAEAIAKAGAKTVLTGHVGPKAAAALAAAGVAAIEHCEGQTVQQAVQKHISAVVAET